MSTANIDNKVAVDSGICNCSICLENFKTPKYLPCLHTFCLKCLESYIVSSSKTGKTRPDHFNCPVCRAEVKPPDPTSPVADWAKLMPNNHMINKLMEASSKSSEMPNQTNECDPCKYDGESITGEFWCFDCRDFLCEKCRKEHMRNKSSRFHKLVPRNEVSKQDIFMAVTDVEEPCMDHKGELLKVYCIDHQKMCCVLCLSINHRKCENIKTFDEMADDMKIKGEIKQFSDQMKEIDSKVDKIATRKRENIASIQDQQTATLNKVEDFVQKAKDKLDQCHLDFKDAVAITHKEHTTKLTDAAERIESFQKSMTNFQKMWKAELDSGSPKQIFVTLKKIKERIETEGNELEEFFKKDEMISYEVTINKLATDITSLTSIAEIEVKITPCDQSLLVDICGILTTNKTDINVQPKEKQPIVESICVENIKPVKLWDVKVNGGDFTGGVFLKDDRLLLMDSNLKTMNVYGGSGKTEICQSVSYRPLDAVQHTDHNVYVSSNSDTNIRVYTMISDSFQEIITIKTDIPYSRIFSLGITNDNHMLAECEYKIYLMTMDGKTKRKINRSTNNSYIATSTSDKRSLLHYCVGPQLICESVDGEEIMRYKIPGIRTPGGIALDKVGSIYVVGVISKNVCVVSKDGKSCRVIMSDIEGIDKPYAIGFYQSGTKFFITGDGNGTAAVYTLRN